MRSRKLATTCLVKIFVGQAAKAFRVQCRHTANIHRLEAPITLIEDHKGIPTAQNDAAVNSPNEAAHEQWHLHPQPCEYSQFTQAAAAVQEPRPPKPTSNKGSIQCFFSCPPDPALLLQASLALAAVRVQPVEDRCTTRLPRRQRGQQVLPSPQLCGTGMTLSRRTSSSVHWPEWHRVPSACTGLSAHPLNTALRRPAASFWTVRRSESDSRWRSTADMAAVQDVNVLYIVSFSEASVQTVAGSNCS